MSSLADELLADLSSDEEGLDEEESGLINNGESKYVQASLNGSDNLNTTELADSKGPDALMNLDTTGLGEDGNDITTEDLIKRVDFKEIATVDQISKLLPTRVKPILQLIEASETSDNNGSLSSSVVASNSHNSEGYKLLVDANNLSVDIDHEIIMIHKFIKDHYKSIFSDLEEFVTNPIYFVKAVKVIGANVNNIETEKLPFLDGATIMVLKMQISTARPLSASTNNDNNAAQGPESLLPSIYQACDLILELDQAKKVITQYVASRLSTYAPNISYIVGPSTAAQLMGFAGGLPGLSKTPSCNIAALGAKRSFKIGNMGSVGFQRQGFLYHSTIIQSLPPDTRKQAMRIVSGKLVLAARIDMSRSSQDGHLGAKYYQEIKEKLEKLMEPPENKGIKALPVPDDRPSKKRGGRRVRKWKEQFKQSELQQAANTMAFGKPQGEVEGYGGLVDTGMIGASTGGMGASFKNLAADDKTKARMTKGMEQRLNTFASRHKQTPGAVDVSGLSSTVSFTSNRGIEISAPQNFLQQASSNIDKDRWFKSGTFTTITNKSTAGGVVLGPGTPMAPPKRKMDSPTGPDAKRHKE